MVSGCTSELVDETSGEDDEGSNAIDEDIGEFDDFEEDLEGLEDINLDELDF